MWINVAVCSLYTSQCFVLSFCQANLSLSVSSSLFLFLFRVGFAVTGHIDSQKNSRIFVSEVLPDGLAFNEGAYLSANP